MAQQPSPCPGCGRPLALGKHNVCFSDDRCYRYWLQAAVELTTGIPNKGTCLFLMFNPSTADECLSDDTIDRCKKFAKRWGYGTLWVCNLYAFRSPNPKALRKALDDGVDVVGHPLNDSHIEKTAERADKIILGWGGIGINVLGKRRSHSRTQQVAVALHAASALDNLYALCPPEMECLANGQPRHPKPQNLKQMPVSTTECKQVRIGSDGMLAIAD